MKKHIDSINKQKCLTVVQQTNKGAKFKTNISQGKQTDSLCGVVDTKLRKKNDYVLFNPPRVDTTKSVTKSKIAVPKTSIPTATNPTLTSKLLEDLPVKPKKRIATAQAPQFDNYCLFDPKTDFFNEREHVLGTIPETHAVDGGTYPDHFPNVNVAQESYDEIFYFNEMYNDDDDGCETQNMAEMSNVKEINDSKPNISLLVRMSQQLLPPKQNKAIQINVETETETQAADSSKAVAESMNIHELITVIKSKNL